MDNFLDGQAKAIWDALDTMLKEDPQAYRKFISEQLQEGQQMIRKEKQEKMGASSEASALGKMFSGMNIGKGPMDQQVKKEKSSKGGYHLEGDKKLSGKCGEGDAGTGVCGPQLLDDEIGKKSILTQIVKSDDGDRYDELSELQIPQISSASAGPPSKKKMPSIEEL